MQKLSVSANHKLLNLRIRNVWKSHALRSPEELKVTWQKNLIKYCKNFF